MLRGFSVHTAQVVVAKPRHSPIMLAAGESKKAPKICAGWAVGGGAFPAVPLDLMPALLHQTAAENFA